MGSIVRWVVVSGAVGVLGLALPGCLTDLSNGLITPAQLASNLSETESPVVARAQRPESANQLASVQRVATALPPGVEPVDDARGNVRVKVSAMVNSHPIFEDEVLHAGGSDFYKIAQMPEPQRSERRTEVFTRLLDHLIDQEVMYQDAIKKLENANKKALEKLKEFVNHEFEKQLEKMRAMKIPEDHIKQIEPIARRLRERDLISSEYARNRVLPIVQGRIDLAVIQDYYDGHKNEFQTIDKVRWQDVFIAVSPKHPTVAHAHRFAEEKLNSLDTPNDFVKLADYDDGDSKLRGGEGLGQRRGEISPPQVEEILFKLRDGEIAPIYDISTGVHMIRLIKREYAGQMPLDDSLQKTIRRKLEGELFEREYKRIVRDLRNRSVIVKEDVP